MKKVLLILFLLIPVCLFAQQNLEATTELTEQRVILFPNGTWKYKENITIQGNQSQEAIVVNTNSIVFLYPNATWMYKDNSPNKARAGIVVEPQKKEEPEQYYITAKSGAEWQGIILKETESQLVFSLLQEEGKGYYFGMIPYELNSAKAYKQVFIEKKNIIMIRNDGNIRDIYTDNIKSSRPMISEDFKTLGRYHAKHYFKRYRSAFGFSFAGSAAFTPILGIIGPLVLGNGRIHEKDFIYPDTKLILNADYKNAYREGATLKKKRKAWLGYWLGCIVPVGICTIGGIILWESSLLTY